MQEKGKKWRENMHMELTTPRLKLRPYGMSDFDDVYEYVCDKDDIKYMMFLPKRDEQETKDFLREVESQWAKDEPDYYEFGAILDGKLIGAVSVYMEENSTKAELGWIFNKKFRGMGYATEATKAVMEFAIKELHVDEVFACCDTRNKPSEKLMKRLGMELECEQDRCYSHTGEKATEYKYIYKM